MLVMLLSLWPVLYNKQIDALTLYLMATIIVCIWSYCAIMFQCTVTPPVSGHPWDHT